MIYRYKYFINVIKNKISRIYINYLLKKKYFYSNNIKIIYPILIPRKDSELIIILSKFLYCIKKNTMLDLCSGSGNLSIILKNKYKKIKITLIDYNYYSLILNLKLRTSNVIISNIHFFLKNKKKYTYIISNPPYICSKQINLYSKSLKKKKSLHAIILGLNIIISIIKNIYDILNINTVITIEHSYNQEKLIKLLLKNKGFNNIYTVKNISNLPKITYAEK